MEEDQAKSHPTPRDVVSESAKEIRESATKPIHDAATEPVRQIRVEMSDAAREQLAKALPKPTAFGDAARGLAGIRAASIIGDTAKISEALANIAPRAERVQWNLAGIDLAPLKTDGLDDVFRARAQREAEQRSAIIATRDAAIELAAIEAATLEQLRLIAAESATTQRLTRVVVYLTAVGVLIGLVALIVALRA